MHKKVKEIIIYMIVAFIIFASFKIPNILFEIQEYNFEVGVYEKEKSNIDVEAQEIYLVKAINHIKNNDSMVKITYSTIEETVVGLNKNNFTNDIKEEILKLKEYNIIKNMQIDNNSEVIIEMVKKSYKKNSEIYNVNSVKLTSWENCNYKMEIEEKTGKILSIILEKDQLNDDIEKEEILRSYINYLDLNIIDDWVFEDNIMKSNKAKLVTNLVTNGDIYILSILPNDELANENLIEWINVN